ncbi:SCO2525 family SAM-dependent methyltransferase [Actinoplanes derwentensis]|uniref:SCO2525 family SAM-dependent methyltransferase n=1 Tax=Actinoplanes derwentensis TaxID=113562 RepID=UPI0012FDD645|nr:SCO2525 family SAM-dependent methyltransferase [Actinoplanes derwentensis]
MRNSDVDWDSFDSDAYFSYNYGELRPDDAQIIQVVANHFQASLRGSALGQAIDVGAGVNLYPAMVMLPYAASVTLVERAFTNCDWLTTELKGPRPSWGQFWKAVSSGRAAYQLIQKPADVLQDRTTVVRGNIFDLKPGLYDLGTMFFVAESITTRTDEFRRAARLFVNSLKPGAPFAAAFMRDSSGYFVAGKHFPACSVSDADVERALAPFARNLNIVMVESNDLRDGYGGMMVATGRKK